MSTKRTVMPIMGAKLLSEIPFDMIAPHEKQAQLNHYQTLERLAQRGGLSASEALAVLENREWRASGGGPDDEFRLINKVREWRATGASHHE